MTQDSVMIIGLTGKNAAGKGTVSELLRQKSFYYYSLSDVIRDNLREIGRPLTRENLFQMGNELRARHGSQVLAEIIIKRLEPDKNYVVDSFRHPAEVEAFRKRPHFTFVVVEAPAAVRFERLRARRRAGDPTTLEEFIETERREEA